MTANVLTGRKCSGRAVALVQDRQMGVRGDSEPVSHSGDRSDWATAMTHAVINISTGVPAWEHAP